MSNDALLHLINIQKHQLLEAKVQNEMKSPVLAALYCLIFGWMGAHRRYLGDKNGATLILCLLALVLIGPAIYTYMSYDPPAPRSSGSGISLGEIGGSFAATTRAHIIFLNGLGMSLIFFQIFVWFDLLSIPYLMKDHIKDLRAEKKAEMMSPPKKKEG